MATGTRESRLASAFVTLADTLVLGYDVVDLLHTLVVTCADLLDASAAGLLLTDGEGHLEVVASTSESSRLVESMQVYSGQGPCFECFAKGEAVTVEDIERDAGHWPEFQQVA